jgi:hypothetical protein
MRKKLERWCRTHRHPLVFWGAFIVFVTFIVKEGLGEGWKQQADQIDIARSFASIKRREGMTSVELLQLEKCVNQMSAQGIYPAKPTSNVMSSSCPNEPNKEILGTLTEADLAIDETSPIVEVLPDRNKYEARQKQVQVILKSSIDDFIRLTFGLGTHKNEGELLEQANSTNKQAEEFRDEVSTDADNIRRRSARLSTLAWWISTFLFALGWGLGLLGKLYGVPEAAGG